MHYKCVQRHHSNIFVLRHTINSRVEQCELACTRKQDVLLHYFAIILFTVGVKSVKNAKINFGTMRYVTASYPQAHANTHMGTHPIFVYLQGPALRDTKRLRTANVSNTLTLVHCWIPSMPIFKHGNKQWTNTTETQ